MAPSLLNITQRQDPLSAAEWGKLTFNDYAADLIVCSDPDHSRSFHYTATHQKCYHR